MINTLLFDLDGTLLPLNQDYFTTEYMKQLLPRLVHLQEPALLVKRIWSATEEMVRSDEAHLSNEQVFRRAFFNGTDWDEEEAWKVMSDFYEGPFGELAHLTNPTPLAKEVVSAAAGKGYEIVLATNPLFPRSAIEHRMRWAGILEMPWKLVTTLEEMHFCKPNVCYYEEILEKIGRKPQECMMIGNSLNEDMVAAKLGMQTFWITDQPLEAANERPETVSHEGTLSDFMEFLKQQPLIRE